MLLNYLTLFNFCAFLVVFNTSPNPVQGFSDHEMTLRDITSHRCDRECKVGQPMTCEYTFRLDNYYTMSKACFDCPRNVSDCYRPTCIAGNGVQRLLYTANLQLPGPTIVVCQDDIVMVNVKNRLGNQVTSIHWHGIHQVDSPWMDGVPFITQCPINPWSNFQYKFSVKQAGTYFWHSHSPFQIVDGLAGMMVVRQPPKMDPNFRLYDYDLTEHVILISEWGNDTGVALSSKFYDTENSDKLIHSPPILVNGRGQQAYFPGANGTNVYTPLTQFIINPGLKYRFRVCNNVNIGLPIVMTIDNHVMTVIATDGNPVEPYEVEAIVTGQGQRIDFVLNANQGLGNYWIRFEEAVQSPSMPTSFGAANIRYQGAPQMDLTELYEPQPLNVPKNKILERVTNLTSLTPMNKLLKENNPNLFYLSVGSIANYDPLYYNPDYYPWSSYNSSYQKPLFGINGIVTKYPSSPLLTQYHQTPTEHLCYKENLPGNCSQAFCSCIHLIPIPYQRVAELVVVNPVDDYGPHSFHLHGYAFRVVAQDTLPVGMSSVDGFKKLDEENKIKRNFDAPVLMDSVTIPLGGYVILRFIANYRGFWMFHCHMAYHLEAGMALVVQVGHFHDMIPPPQNFPKCGNFN